MTKSEVAARSATGQPSGLVLTDRVVVITGGNRGLGRSIALAMAKAGAEVVIASRNRESLDTVLTELRNHCVRPQAIACDVGDPRSMEQLAETVLDAFGRVDVVVANAGVAGPTKPLHSLYPEEWRECLRVNLDGVYLTFRWFIPSMIERKSGSLIAISSASGKRPIKNRTPYAAAKLGVIGLVRSLALELGPYGVRVNSICPGAVHGPRIEAVIQEEARVDGVSEEEALRHHLQRSPLRRLVEADEVGAASVFLASDAASAITGEDLNVSAGALMY